MFPRSLLASLLMKYFIFCQRALYASELSFNRSRSAPLLAIPYGQAFYGVSVCINVRIKFIESLS